MVISCHALCREQPQFEFLELPNPYTSKLWQDEQSSDGSDTATTTPSTEVASPPSSAARINDHRNALRIMDQVQKPKLATEAELLSVESAIRRAGIQVSVQQLQSCAYCWPGLDTLVVVCRFRLQRKPVLLYDIEAWESATDAQQAATEPLSLSSRHGR